MWRAYIGLGANLPWDGAGPEHTLRSAAQALRKLGAARAGSGLWRTEPVGPVADQPPFLNAAMLLQTQLAPEALLPELLTLERQFGRVRNTGDKGPRTLDLDLLLMEHIDTQPEPAGVVRALPGLLLPHPLLHTRRFVLAPLAEFAPALQHPLLGKTIADLLALLPAGQGAERLRLPGILLP